MSFQLSIVEELAARLRHRRTLYYSQDDYDGILPAVESERVGLAGDDAELMWKVFDYASMSALNGRQSRKAPDAADGMGGQEHNEALMTQPERQAGHPNGNAGVQQQTGPSTSGATTAPAPAPLNFHNLEAPLNVLEQQNLSLFDQLPEDWAFTIDDWTLFGAPGSTYFYNEAS